MTFEFEIGPERITVESYIIGYDKGVYEKRVTYNGAEQTLSIMHVSRDKMDIDSGGLRDNVADNVLTVWALNAGTYTITLTPKSIYCWADGSSDPLEFTFIIDKQKITAPYLVDSGDNVKDNVKTVTYGGETDDNGEKWYETMTFANADEAKVIWRADNGINQYIWYDQSVVLSGRSAGEYNIYFECLDNYEWADGVDTPHCKLIINKRPIDLPFLIEDNDGDGTFKNGNQKTVPFDFQDHTIHLNVGLSGSVTISYNEALTRVWKDEGLDPYVTFTGRDSANYEIVITPTANYCWKGDVDILGSRVFIFRIAPISLASLDMELQSIGASTGNITWQKVPDYRNGASATYDGTAKTVRVGGDPTGDPGTYYDKSRWHFYQVVDGAGNLILPQDYAEKQITVTDTNGYVTFSAINAGTYFIRINLQDNNYTWDDADEADGTSVTYKFVINQRGIEAPTVNKPLCVGNQLTVTATGIYGVFYNQDFTLALSLKGDYSPFIGVDVDLKGEGMTYEGWVDGVLRFNAFHAGTHTVVLTVTDPNYKWSSGQDTYEFDIRIAFAPISGIELWYVSGDTETQVGAKDLRNGASESYNVTFSENDEVIFIKRSATAGLILTDFSDQLGYEFTAEAIESGFTVNMNELLYNADELRLSAFDAGVYTIVITPKADYCWKDSQESKKPVTITFTIEKLEVVLPTLIAGDGTIVNGSTKKITYSGAAQTLDLNLYAHPLAYSAHSWTAEPDNSKSAGMVEPVVDEEASMMTAKATSSGIYKLLVVLSNKNNYKWPANFVGEETTFYLQIVPKGIKLPQAYLVDDGVDYTTVADALKTGATGSPLDRPLGPAQLYEQQHIYDGFKHIVYVLGDTVSDGAFKITYSAGKPSNMLSGASSGEMLNSGDDRYFKLTATNVDTYTITVEFITDANNAKNYFWDDNSGTENRTFKFSISKKLIQVPVFKDYANQQLENDSRFAHYTFDGNNVSFDIINCFLGDKVSATEYKYINVKISDAATGAYTKFKISDAADANGSYTVTMSTNGSPSGNYASVPVTYCIEFYINSANERWDTSGSDDTVNKKFFITVEKMKVQIPEIQSTSILMNQFSKSVTYTGDVWTDELVLTGIKDEYIDWRLATPDTMEGVYDGNGTLSVSTKVALADTYTVIFSLKDSDNMEWAHDASIDDLNFSLIVDPYTIAKPYILVENNAGQEGVVGLTKTVTYNYEQQYIKIGGYWNDDDEYRWMNQVEVTSAVPFDYEDYIAGYFAGMTLPSPYDVLDYIYNGLLIYGATDAGTYTVKFSLTRNAVWADGTTDDVTVTFVIEKLQYETPYIKDDGTGIISGLTKTFTYKLDASGNPDTHTIEIGNFNYDDLNNTPVVTPNGDPIMFLKSVTETTGADTTIANAGITTVADNEFTAQNAATYEIIYALTDFANTRWKYADKETITFTFKVNKLSLDKPETVNTYRLENETITADSLKVDYDTRMHSIMIDNIVGLYSQFTDTNPRVSSSKTPPQFTDASFYLGMTDVTVYNADMDTLIVSWYRDAKADTTGKTVGDLYDFGSYVYEGILRSEHVDRENILMFTASTPGTYSMKLNIVDKHNMQWSDATDADAVFNLIVNKMKHDAPRVAAGTSVTQQYNGENGVDFKIRNVFNGIEEENGPKVSWQYEQYKIEYTDRDGVTTTVIKDFTDAATAEELSWFNGELTLHFKDVGTYTVTVRIDPALAKFVEWSDGEDEWPQMFSVTERSLSTKVSFSSTDEKTNAELQMGATSWCISTPVTATVRISGLVFTDSSAMPPAIDRALKLKVYFKFNDTGVVTQMLPESSLVNGYILGQNEDGTFYIDIAGLAIPHGQGNIDRGAYTIYVEQCYDADITPLTCNYLLGTPTQDFTIKPDEAPFDKSLLQWEIATTSAPDNFRPASEGLGATADNRMVLDYIQDPSVSYIIRVSLTPDGYKGPNGDKNHTYAEFNLALNEWWVNQVGNLGGTTTAQAVGQYTASITLAALDPELYSFDTQTFNFYYEISAGKYNLSGLKWDYVENGSIPFKHDGTAKAVALTGTFPDGLSVLRYETTVTYVSGGVTYSNVNAGSSATANNQTYVGIYTTTVVFTKNTNNYTLPTNGNTATYDGTFEWSVTWTIEKEKIQVGWQEGERDSNGTVISYRPQIGGDHANKFDYTLRKWDATANDGAGDWVEVSSMTRKPGEVVKFEVTPILKSTPTNGATDYDRNYEFEVIGEENPLIYEAGGDDIMIANHVEINGKTDKSYVYTGSGFDVSVVIDVDESGGVITESSLIVNVYSEVNLSLPLTYKPYAIGRYVVKIQLSYTGASADYYLTVDEFEFEITKASFDEKAFEWRYFHEYADGTEVVAKWDDARGEWLNVDTNDVVDVVFDTIAHRVRLVNTNPDYDSIITINTSNGVESDAGTYEALAGFNYDASLYYEPNVQKTFPWTIKKKYLDLSKVKWEYEGDYVYTRVNNTEKEFSVKVVNIPDELLDYVVYVTTYTTPDGLNTEQIENAAGTKAGAYYTICTISGYAENEFFVKNYEVGAWPSDVVNNILDWEIATKVIKTPKPTAETNWDTFDGKLHNLINVFNIDRKSVV